MVELLNVRVENLRGYYNASLSLERSRILLVGPNNSGKTSLLRLLDWALNRLGLDSLKGEKAAGAEDLQFLLPARDAKHRARRMIMTVRVQDGRSWTKFDCDRDGITRLRVNLRMTPRPIVYAALGKPRRGERPTSDRNAVELLRRLRQSVRFMHVPSFRDAKSTRFKESLAGAIQRRVNERAIHTAQGGAPQEYRKAASAFSDLREVLLSLARPLWDDVESLLPRGMTDDASVTLDCDLEGLLHFMEARLRLQVSTGEHDSASVPMVELGSGLQSLLDLAIQEAEIPKDRHVIIAVEEPEAFLHPSAQRTIGTRLLEHDDIDQTIVTTHSPIIVEEAKFGDVVLCRDQKFFEPSAVADEERSEINTALLSGFGAEMMFARSVLLVEGEGDRQFFEGIRRRIALHDDDGECDLCFVVPVGGKTRFAPWIRLVQAYGDAGDRPVRWLVAADGDASKDVRRAFRDSGVTVPQGVLDALGEVSEAKTKNDLPGWRTAIERFNAAALPEDLRVVLLSLDLEESMLVNAEGPLLTRVSDSLGRAGEPASREEVLDALGAKGFGNGEGSKEPWLRGLVGSTIRPQELSEVVTTVMSRWFAGAMDPKKPGRLLQTWQDAERG